MPDINFEIIDHIGVISTQTNWNKELNLISWNGGEPKLDIRSWNPDHSKMSRGITLTVEEIGTLAEIINKYLED